MASCRERLRASRARIREDGRMSVAAQLDSYAAVRFERALLDQRFAVARRFHASGTNQAARGPLRNPDCVGDIGLVALQV